MGRRRAKKAAFGIAKVVSKAAPYIAFFQQLTEKDLAVLPSNRSYIQQGKDALNILTGRMAGFHLFNAPSDYKPPFTINPQAILTSKWVQGGAGMIAYSMLGKKFKFLPKAGTIGSIGKKIAFGGAIGALFDAPNGQSTNAQSSTYVAPQPPERASIPRQQVQYVPQYQNRTYPSYSGNSQPQVVVNTNGSNNELGLY